MSNELMIILLLIMVSLNLTLTLIFLVTKSKKEIPKEKESIKELDDKVEEKETAEIDKLKNDISTIKRFLKNENLVVYATFANLGMYSCYQVEYVTPNLEKKIAKIQDIEFAQAFFSGDNLKLLPYNVLKLVDDQHVYYLKIFWGEERAVDITDVYKEVEDKKDD